MIDSGITLQADWIPMNIQYAIKRMTAMGSRRVHWLRHIRLSAYPGDSPS